MDNTQHTHYSVQVTAPARLHLGFVDLNGELGRQFGSIGLTVTDLDAVVSASPSAAIKSDGLATERAVRTAKSALAALRETRGVALTVVRAPPSHAGLGSGTQLDLAIAVACARLYGHAATPRELAPAVGRGLRSGIGIAAFEGGGFIVDGGRTGINQTAPVLSQLVFPTDWQIILIFDDHARGLHGAVEREAFVSLPPMSGAVAADIARWCLVGILPAVADADFAAFVAAVSAVQRRIGQYFAPAQGGAAFTSPRVAEIVTMLRRQFGDIGAGQSSWGPTAFAFAPNAGFARDMKQCAERGADAGLRVQIVRGCNHGAKISDTQTDRGWRAT